LREADNVNNHRFDAEIRDQLLASKEVSRPAGFETHLRPA
jgi:hypothetical protein